MESLEVLERKYHDIEGKFSFIQRRSEQLRRRLDHLPIQILDTEGKDERQSLQEEYNCCAMELLTLPAQLEEMERRRVLALLEWRSAQFSHLKSKAKSILHEEMAPLQGRIQQLGQQLENAPEDVGLRDTLKKTKEELSSIENRYKQADAQAAIFASSVAHEVGVSLSSSQDWEGHARKLAAIVKQEAPSVHL